MLLHASFALALLANGPADLGPVPAGTLRVYLVRHGQSYTNLTPPPDLPPDQLDRLTAVGQAQARLAAAALSGKAVTVIVTSPKGRTKDTAIEMQAALGKASMRIDERLRPLELGQDAGGKLLEWADRMRDWSHERDATPPSGESLEEAGLRVLRLLSELKKECAGQSVVLVSHGELIQNLLGMLASRGVEARFSLRLANASISALDAKPASLPQILFEGFVPEPARAPGAR
jgi:probable phosphoglycerate mutase